MGLMSTLGWATIIAAFSFLLGLIITEVTWQYVLWSDRRDWDYWLKCMRQNEEERMREECEKLFTTRQNSSNEEMEEKP